MSDPKFNLFVTLILYEDISDPETVGPRDINDPQTFVTLDSCL